MSETLRIDHLHLQSFRCFSDCAIGLHENLTVLVAENGQGKTAILDCLGDAVEVYVDALTGARQFHALKLSDVHLVQGPDGAMTPSPPTGFSAGGQINGEEIHWAREIKTYGRQSRSSTKGVEDLKQAASRVGQSVRNYIDGQADNPPILPLVAFYGTGRLWNENDVNESRKKRFPIPQGRISGYADCLSSKASFGGLLAWFENAMSETGDPRFSRKLSENLALLEAVRNATKIVLAPTKWEQLSWNAEHRRLDVKHPEYGVLPLSALSDGVRNMIALVADIARRCATLNPHFGEEAAEKTPGLLLVDEVDMHLHPSWQQLVIDLLRKAFPSLQMVLTTHSPHVLSTVDKDSIRVISLRGSQGIVETPTFQTRGVESADVLASIMRVDPVPQLGEAQLLSQYRALIEDGYAERDDAQALRSRLVAHFSETHPVIIECDRLIRFQNFKVKRSRPEEEPR
jgi:predicted ATP-binding protein involved in virulence